MRKALQLPIIVLLAGFLMGHAALANTLPAPTASYDADVVSDVGDNHNTASIVAIGPRQRLTIHLDGGDQTVLLQRDTGKVFLLLPALNSAMQLDRKTMGGYDLTMLNTLQVTPEADETIGGQQATRYAAEVEDKHGRFAGHVWATADGVILKIDGITTSNGNDTPVRIELTHLHRKPQNALLVALPPTMKVMPFGLGALLGSQPGYPVSTH